MALDKQINLFRVDTNAFLNEDEKEIINKTKEKTKGLYEDKEALNELIKAEKSELSKEKSEQRIKELEEEIKTNSEIIEYIDKEISEYRKYEKEDLLFHFLRRVTLNKMREKKKIRELDEKYLSYIDKRTIKKEVNLNNVISMFESSLSRGFKIKTNELTYDIIVLEVFYYDIAQDLILNGFNYNNKHYVYFSSSAGQIRTKKAVFVEEEKYNACKNKLMCGLSIEKINKKGGMNINKFLAYLALSNSATDLWEDVFDKKFDIDRAIVVDDFETNVKCKVDNIDYNTYEITPNVEQEIPIPHIDGCGMILSTYCNKNFMVRLPFIKGLLGSFNYVKFIIDNGCSSKIKDIWGKEYDVITDNIQIIFTKSQLKMYKYYDSWDEYKEAFKKYECEACVCNMEEEEISNAKINYQMLQTLHDMTDEEIKSICAVPNRKIQKISDRLENALEFFGVDMRNDEKRYRDYFQKALKIYPELIKDPATKQDLRDLKNSLIKKYRGAKLDVTGKFTFVLPDLYAFCEWLFMGKEVPLGLLENNEVYCRLYPTAKKLDCLRSPHLYIEHAVRKNVCDKVYRGIKLSDWYNTDAIYTSTYDLISRILQFDVDGDRLLVLAQKKLIEIAERNMKGVNPLYYEMKKAKAEIIDNQSIYNGLKLAFTGGKIGGISNDITKIWNSGEITEEAKKAIKWLCMETNFTIDYAKTLFKPTRPDEVDKILKNYKKGKVPHFFYYAKNKTKDQVEGENESVVNRIGKAIKDNKNMFRPMKNLEDINYLLLLYNKEDNGYVNEEVNKIFDKWNRNYGTNLNFDEDNTNKNNIAAIATEVKKDLHSIEESDINIINSLVTMFYKKPSTRKKKLLWYVYGEELYNNLLQNIEESNICTKCGKRTQKPLKEGECSECVNKKVVNGEKIITCMDCGKEFKVKAKNTKSCRCSKCQKAHDYVGIKVKVCIDCGKEYIIEGQGRGTNRCPECYTIYRKKYKSEKEKARRMKKKGA